MEFYYEHFKDNVMKYCINEKNALKEHILAHINSRVVKNKVDSQLFYYHSTYNWEK